MAEDALEDRRRFAHTLLSPLTVILGAAETLANQIPPEEPMLREMAELILEHARRLHTTLNRLAETAEVRGSSVHAQWREEEKTDGSAGPVEATLQTPAAIGPREDLSQPSRILILDDDAAARKALGDILREGGFTVLEAGSSTEAIDLARLSPPDLILLDLSLPVVDGPMMYSVFQGDPMLRRIPIVVTTDAPRPEDVGWTFPWVVPKPASPQQLLQTIASALATPLHEGRRTVLIADDEPGVREEIRQALSARGFFVQEAGSGAEALTLIAREPPDIVVVDLYLPDLDGMEIVRQLRAQENTLTLPVLFLSVVDDPMVKAQGLRLGADDYLVKPFSIVELSARIEAILRRKALEFSFSPSTRLPGNIAIERELRTRVASRQPFAVCYVDLDSFKAYNDVYGFLKGDGVIHQTARVLSEAIRQHGASDDFLGHVGGDDFVLITSPERADAICEQAVREFERVIPLYYDAEARTRGYIEALDRQGRPARFPLMTMTIVIVSTESSAIAHPAQLIDLMLGPKQQAKQTPGSTIVHVRVDLRSKSGADG
ncbi:MAG: response regulator [Chloroflexia bacterium]